MKIGGEVIKIPKVLGMVFGTQHTGSDWWLRGTQNYLESPQRDFVLC